VPPRLEQAVHTIVGMQLRTRPDAFIRSLVDAATVRPFWSALRAMRQARVCGTPVAEPALVTMPPLVAAKAA
jgi:hypothetical protein